jgi:DNA-directed RNA polymerase specialized sigma24 family protein
MPSRRSQLLILATPATVAPSWSRQAQRFALRDFLRYTHRQRDARARFIVTDHTGRSYSLTRASLGAAVDRLPIRQRRVVELVIEQGLSHYRACAALHGISSGTLSLDLRAALETLLDAVLCDGTPLPPASPDVA